MANALCGNIVESAAMVNLERVPDFLHGIAECGLTRQFLALRHKPATLPRVGLSSFRRATTPPARKSPTQANVARSDGLGVELALMARIAVCFHVIDVHRVGGAGGSAVLNVPHVLS